LSSNTFPVDATIYEIIAQIIPNYGINQMSKAEITPKIPHGKYVVHGISKYSGRLKVKMLLTRWVLCNVSATKTILRGVI